MIIQTYNPIKEETDFKNKVVPIVPVPVDGENIILYSERSGEWLLLPENKMTPWQIYKRGFNKTVVIDTMPKTVQFKDEFSTKKIGVNFVIEIYAKVKVSKPEMIWRNRINDVADELLNRMQFDIRNIALKHDIREYLNVQNELETCLKKYCEDKDSDIYISSILCNVRLQKEYEDIIKNKEIEIAKTNAANEIAENCKTDKGAIYTDVLDGKITQAQARQREKENERERFDDMKGRSEAMIEMVENLRDKDLMGSTQANKCASGIFIQNMIYGQNIGLEEKNNTKEDAQRSSEGE